MNSESFFSSSCSGVVCVESGGMKGERYITIPRKCWSCCLLSGGGILWIASTFLGVLRLAPLASYTVLKNVTESFLTWRFSPLKTSPCSQAVHMKLCRFLSWSSLSFPWMTTSSVIPMTPSQHSRIWSHHPLKEYSGHMIGPRGGIWWI